MSQPIDHERAFELLPWLVNGSLLVDERDAVEEHLRSCLPCRRELKEQQRLRSAVRVQPAVHISPQSGFDKLSRDLAETPLDVSARPARFAAFTRFAAVAAAGIALLAVLLWLVPAHDDRPEYNTLATPPAAGVRIDVIFSQAVTAGDIQALLDEIGGEISAGPTDLGRYTVRLDTQDAGAPRRDEVLARLRTDPRVRFAGPALAGEQP